MQIHLQKVLILEFTEKFSKENFSKTYAVQTFILVIKTKIILDHD